MNLKLFKLTLHYRSTNSAINPLDPNLYPYTQQSYNTNTQVMQHLQSSFALKTLNSNEIFTNEKSNTDKNSNKRKYICKVCREPGHNARKCTKQHQ
ncbi:9426_t:CDS:2 [Funneliformis caledonium]|uniref:9426_t:CDS:1 n=1 Tax=Funneliformis caledonium TaxID=1117310 RepID=A0A9N8Z262_9GLOM|nr:9426_t:CDS:2 [Funneliformis caledonium]